MEARMSIMFVLAEDVTSGCLSVRVLYCISLSKKTSDLLRSKRHWLGFQFLYLTGWPSCYKALQLDFSIIAPPMTTLLIRWLALSTNIYQSCMRRCHTADDYYIKEIEHTCVHCKLREISYTNFKCHGLCKMQQPLPVCTAQRFVLHTLFIMQAVKTT